MELCINKIVFFYFCNFIHFLYSIYVNKYCIFRLKGIELFKIQLGGGVFFSGHIKSIALKGVGRGAGLIPNARGVLHNEI